MAIQEKMKMMKMKIKPDQVNGLLSSDKDEGENHTLIK